MGWNQQESDEPCVCHAEENEIGVETTPLQHAHHGQGLRQRQDLHWTQARLTQDRQHLH
jgi:hypothetical protein